MNERRDVIKNRKAILQGYIDMTSEKNIEKITVSDVIKKANVSRATFYAHYKDVNTLKETFEMDFTNILIKQMEESISMLFKDSSQSVFNIFNTFEKNKKMVSALSGNGTSESFFLLFKKSFSNELMKQMCTNNKAVSVVTSQTISSIIIDNCRDIVVSKRKTISNETRATIVSHFIPKKV